MDSHIVTVYTLTDDLLKRLNHHEDAQCKMSDAEVLTTAMVAALFFRGNAMVFARSGWGADWATVDKANAGRKGSSLPITFLTFDPPFTSVVNCRYA